MEEQIVLVTILGMAVVTYLPRLGPLLALSGKELPPAVVSWLRHVPPAVLAAMLLPLVVIQGERISLGLDNLFFWAAVPTLLVAIFTKSLYLPVLVGMLVVVLGRWLGT